MSKLEVTAECKSIVDLPNSYGLVRMSFVQEPYHGTWFDLIFVRMDEIKEGKKYRVTIEEVAE